MTRFNTGITRTSAGYEINDAGFLTRADVTSNGNWFGLQLQEPTRYYRRVFANFNQWNEWNTEGLHLNTGGNINLSVELPTQWWVYTGFNMNAIGETYDDRAARGGPALRQTAQLGQRIGRSRLLQPRCSVGGD